jgi:hypothetical protein
MTSISPKEKEKEKEKEEQEEALNTYKTQDTHIHVYTHNTIAEYREVSPLVG